MILSNKKKKITIGATAILVLGIGLFSWFLYSGYSGENRTDDDLAPIVCTMVIDTQKADNSYIYAGDVRGRFESRLAFQVGGKIIGRYVEVGSAVKKGQTLLEIDAKDLEQIVNAQKAQLAQAESQLQLAQKDIRRYRSLFEEDVVSRSQFEQISCAYDVARARLEQAQAQYSRSLNQYGYTKLKADQAGVVASINAEVGQVIGPGQIIVTVVRSGEREIEISVPENRIDAVGISSGAQITFWALPGLTLEGKIREIAPMADPALRTYQVRVALTDVPGQIRLGMTASVRISASDGKRSAPYIPLSSLYQTGDRPQVWLVQNGCVSLRPVETGGFDRNRVQILSGLENGDVIVVAGVHKLRQGQNVKAVSGKP